MTVEYDKIQDTFREALDFLDQNKDGKVDADDARALYDRALQARHYLSPQHVRVYDSTLTHGGQYCGAQPPPPPS